MNSSNNKVSNDDITIIAQHYSATLPSAGEERLKADYRMYGGLLLLLGLCASYGSFAVIASLAGTPTASSGLPLVILIAAVIQFFVGVVCMTVGYAAAVMDVVNSKLTSIALGAIQLARLPFTAGLSWLVVGAMSDPESNPFIPIEYNPTTTDIRFIGSMCIIAFVAYAIGFIDSLEFMAFSMHTIQKDTPEHRPGLYFCRRARFYNALLMLAGFTQLAIGSYVLNKFGQGPLQRPVSTGVYGVIFFPEISITVGALQMTTGFIGLIRTLHKSSNDKTRNLQFQGRCLFTFICIISMQDLSQIANAPGGMAAAFAPSLACFYFGLTFMPAFLDWKMITVPKNLDHYYESDEISSCERLEKGERCPEDQLLKTVGRGSF